jgi:hypothetical protein
VQYLFNWGNGTTSGWLPVGTTSAHKSWSSSNTYTVKAQARSATNTSIVSTYSNGLAVSISLAEKVSTPKKPSGPTIGDTGTTYTYSSGGAVDNLGNSVQYLFNWGDNTTSGWLPVGTTSANKAWSSSKTYTVKAQARSATNTSIVSSNSSGLTVSISSKAQMLSPVPKSTLKSSSVTFSWSAGTASAYQLYVGNSAGASDIYNSGQVSVRSVTVSNLPTDGRTLYVRLWSLVGGTWYYNDYTYKAL